MPPPPSYPESRRFHAANTSPSSQVEVPPKGLKRGSHARNCAPVRASRTEAKVSRWRGEGQALGQPFGEGFDQIVEIGETGAEQNPSDRVATTRGHELAVCEHVELT